MITLSANPHMKEIAADYRRAFGEEPVKRQPGELFVLWCKLNDIATLAKRYV